MPTKNWYKLTNGGVGSKSVHAHLKTDTHREIEFQCGLQRHMDDTILSNRDSKKCPRCTRYLKTPKQTPRPPQPKKLYVVIQQGGSSTEMYVHPHDTVQEARADMRGCAKASYRTAGPIEIPESLTAVLLKDKDVQDDLWTLLETAIRAACEL